MVRDHLLVRFQCNIGRFNPDYSNMCILCKNNENSKEHVFNNCPKTKEVRDKFLKVCHKYNFHPRNAIEGCNIIYYGDISEIKKAIKEKAINEGVIREENIVNKMKKFIKGVYSMLWEADGKKATTKNEEELYN